MKSSLVAGILSLAGGAAHAQAPATPPSPPLSTPAREEGRPMRFGPQIRIERADISLMVRCGEGETAKSCGEIVVQLLEKLPAAPSTGDRREGYRDPDRFRGGGYRDRDREGRDRDRGSRDPE